ncbi:MAG TPA: peroxiredoxin [Segeticoccus sp.]|jgi:peroxiredoxin (alkyl hydroperoxide reductase subunit C)|nr:peroxiredoxin [Segeticoccus sp.]
MSPTVPVAEGDRAPDFTLPDQHGQDVSLSGFRGHRSVLLVFYPFAFSGICTGELRGVRDERDRFQNDRVQVLALSCDPMFALRAWSDAEGHGFPLLSDFWPHGEVARRYGVFRDDGGFAIRGTFLVDPDGVVRWSLVNGPGEARDLSGVEPALAGLG